MSLGEEGAQGEEQEPDAPSVLQSNEKLSDERADEELWVISSALQVTYLQPAVLASTSLCSL